MFGSFGIRETHTGDGTSALNIALSAVTGFPRFSTRYVAGDLVPYAILDTTVTPPAPVECGLGTVKASNTLDRTYPTDTWDGTTYDDTEPSRATLVNARSYLVISPHAVHGSQPALHAVSNAHSASRRVNSAHNVGHPGSTLVVTALRLYVMPFLIQSLKRPVDIAMRVSSPGGAGTLLRLGLYRLDDTGAITDRLEESGNIAADTAGIKSYTFAAATRYENGWYAVAFASDGTPTVNTIGTTGGSIGGNPFGVDSNNQIIACKHVTLGSLSLPNPFSGTVTNLLANGSFPHISMGISA